MLRTPLLVIAGMILALPAIPQSMPPQPAFGQELEGFAYPYPVANFQFSSQRQRVQMAYMDVAPAVPNGQTAVLLHGKNFCAATWRR